ncbi:nucleotidyltransferase [Vagococcus coleopterorum]|uniref:tRNA(Met) cytidine acetate ligase n=1 Tax=Vagococcus coleopterorum TaxID=2714946 RepID=A0A6G8AP07_9ENTE|nr:nucleotidyltransferase [Vagococcus coleopterorum]QIL46727.1 nucleotidyltransferase [Vagococcus coleopterorum]
MLTSCGVIVEYNPFHTGHQYHLMKAREASGADVVIAVMSGNFLQRGEPAIVDKWQRAEAALANGADLVIELPTAYAVQSADYFAEGGVSLLHALGVDSLCFGTDSEEILDYEAFAKFNQTNKAELEQSFQELQGQGLSYPQQMTAVYQKLYPNWPLKDNSPNHILGMSYAKANQEYPEPMTLYPIQRQGAGYHEKGTDNHDYLSATAIREALKENRVEEIKSFVPRETMTALINSSAIDWETAWPLLKYQLISQTVEELGQIYQMTEGIEYRLKEMSIKAQSFDEFVSLVKNKRFTWTRIQRLSTYVLLGIKHSDIEAVRTNPYIRVLGFNTVGKDFLNQQKNDLELPLIVNVNQKNHGLVNLDIKAGQVYDLLTNSQQEQDYRRKPIVID